jgi:hypothetical protein
MDYIYLIIYIDRHKTKVLQWVPNRQSLDMEPNSCQPIVLEKNYNDNTLRQLVVSRKRSSGYGWANFKSGVADYKCYLMVFGSRL